MSYASRPEDLKKESKRQIKNRENSQKLPYKTNTRKAVKARDDRVAEWPDFNDRRERMVGRRNEVIDSLDELHKKLRSKWKKHGIKVYDANTSEDACNYIYEIAKRVEEEKQSGKPVRFLKSKSMLSEEIEINSYLEKRGIFPVETDLGEYIVQLRKEAPSHITMPGMHLDRNDVGKLFEEKLEVPYTNDPPELTQIARKVLRRQFLEIDIGMVGVNFAVAESGHVATVTNEGNGRMVSTLPKVVIALMGYERVTQSLDDLALLWQLLARSATGQRATSYLNLLYGPSPGPTGPDEVHVIIVDNGRKQIEKDNKLHEVLRCIRCGACLNVCPVYQQIGGHPYGGVYPGPIGKVLSPLLLNLDQAPEHPFASTLCGACEEICPMSIPIPEMLLELRKRKVKGQKGGVAEKAVWKMFSKTMLSDSAYSKATKSAKFATGMMGKKGYLPGWTQSHSMPEFAGKSFKDLYEEKEIDGDGKE